jgi:predicted permease
VINLRFAFRLLWKTPFVTVVAIASLALGIGANAAIFSLFNQVLLRPLPVSDPGALVNFTAPGPNPGSQSCGMAGDCDAVFSYPMFRDLEREQKVFAGIAAHVAFGANLAARNKTLSGDGMMVSGSYFPVLGLHPALGRLLGPDDDGAPGASRVAVLSYAYWQTTFGSDPAVLNQPLIVNGQSLTIVGVAPRGFASTTLGLRPQVFVPITLRGLMRPGFDGFEKRRSYWAYLFARLKPGVSAEQAAAAINVPYHAILNNVEAPLQEGMSDKTMAKFKAKQVVLSPGAHGQSSVDREARMPLTMLLAVTAFVLLIACANIANLLLARSAARSGEMAVRLSIGGSRGQLVAQLMAESLILGLIGGILGLGVARATLGLISSMLPDQANATFTAHLDLTAVLFAAALTILTALVFGLVPALYATRPDLTSAIRASTGQPSGGRSASRWRTSLATAQIALSMALLGAAGLFTKSLANISRVDLGVKVEHVVTFAISPVLNGYKAPQSAQLVERLTSELRQVPGVTGVTSSLVPLLAGDNWGNDVDVEGFATGPDVDNNSRFNEVGPLYFSTLGVPLMAGREFTSADGLSAPQVAIVNQAFAKKFNLGANPVGKRMDQGNKKFDILIVGMAQDAKYSEVKAEIPPLFFMPLTQDSSVGSANFYVRTSLDPKLLIPAIPRVVARLDANLPLETLRTMPEQIRENVFMDRFISLFSAAFAALATLLAAIGLYGVLAYTVAQRTREIGVRMALGAAPSRVLLMILRQVGMMTLVGGVVGIAAAVGAGRLAQSLLYRMQGSDPGVLALAAVTLSVVAVGAGMVPAYRASRVEPTRALRYE